ncbi:WYL domain-containing protein [Thomasclavelia sp.]|uniref:helix-turn-helix transcriptional regulator n=1 Tax=Thomasclavelia sp. TaxID=3025757 RepID=UPI0025F6C041|nr:WYL domain-containing protein [Thomasclavelia sp.]
MGEKLFYVFKVIKESSEPISGKDIVEALSEYGIKVDIKTVYSLIERINDFYTCLTGKKLIQTIRRKGFIIAEDFFEDGQLQFLVDNVVSNPNLDQKAANELVNKLLLLSSTNQSKRLYIEKKPSQDLTFDLLVNLTTIIKAINNHRNIAFKYVSYDIKDNRLTEVYHTNGNLNEETYMISPYQILVRNSIYYLVGYFNKRKDSLSVYRVDRMRLVMNQRGRFEEISKRYDIVKEFENNVNMFFSNEHIDLIIIFNRRVIREVVSQFGKDIIVRRIDKERVEARIFNVALSDGLIGWLMMLQNKVEVVAPSSLRINVKNRLRSMLAMYDEGN